MAADVITFGKGKIGKEDLEFNTAGAGQETFQRYDRNKNLISVSKIHAGHIPFSAVDKYIEDLVDGGFDVPIKPLTMYYKLITKTSNYTLTTSDTIVLCDASAGNITLTLPSASGIDGKHFVIKKIDNSSNIVTISPFGGETIDGSSSRTLSAQYDLLNIISDGTNWIVLSAFVTAIGIRDKTRGLVIQNNSANPTYKVDINADEILLKDDGDNFYKATSVDLTVDITVSGANGLDTGSEATDTWYHIWVIYNGTTVAGLLSVSDTSPTMPSGYTYKAYVGAIYNNSAGNFIDIYQTGTRVIRSDSQVLSNGTASSTTAIDLSKVVPSTAKKVAGTVDIASDPPAADGLVTLGLRLGGSSTLTINAVVFRTYATTTSGGWIRMPFTSILQEAQKLYYYIMYSGTKVGVLITEWEYE